VNRALPGDRGYRGAERRRLRLEREGVPIEQLPPALPPTAPAGYASDLQLSIAETLRAGRSRSPVG